MFNNGKISCKNCDLFCLFELNMIVMERENFVQIENVSHDLGSVKGRCKTKGIGNIVLQNG